MIFIFRKHDRINVVKVVVCDFAIIAAEIEAAVKLLLYADMDHRSNSSFL